MTLPLTLIKHLKKRQNKLFVLFPLYERDVTTNPGCEVSFHDFTHS